MKTKTYTNFYLKYLLLVVFFQITLLNNSSISQEKSRLPEYFVEINNHSNNLQENITRANKLFKNKYEGTKFWIGYRFELREDVEFDNIHIHDDGGISISSRGFGGYQLSEDDDLETYLLQALSELGVEDARAAYKKLKSKMVEYNSSNFGLFFLLDSDNSTVKKVQLLQFRNKNKLQNYPVFWFGEIAANESFQYLTAIIQNNNYQERIIKPAIFVLSLHEHPEVIKFLTRLAGTNRLAEIRENTVFWLGQIPQEESFQALVNLFEKEKSRQLREKIVFSISQHNSDKVFDFLAEVALNDPDEEVREKAIFWLGQNDREESLDLLQNIYQETNNTHLKEKLVFSISQHESVRAVDILIKIAEQDKNYEVRKKAIFWLGQMASDKTLEALGDIVENDAETDVKTKAVFAISQHQNSELAVDMLMDIARKNKNPEVRKKAIFWLGQTGDARALNFFKDILTK